MDEVASALRSCLMLTKTGVPVDQINREYRELEGENIPFKRLGYSTLEDFLRSVPRVRLFTRNGRLHAEAVPDEKSAHLAALISKQRSNRKKRRSTNMPMCRRPNLNMYQGNRGNNFRAPPRINRPPPRSSMSSSPPMRPAGAESAFKFSSGNVTVYPAKTSTQPNVTVYPGNTPTLPGNVTVYPGNKATSSGNVTIYPGNTTASTGNVTVYPGNTPKSSENVTVYPAQANPMTPPATPPACSQGQTSTSSLAQRLQKAQNPTIIQKPVLQPLNTSAQNRLSQAASGPSSAPVYDNRVPEERLPRSAPIYSEFSMVPLQNCLSGFSDPIEEKKRTPIKVTLNTENSSRQISVPPPLVPSQSAPPPLKIRPLSDRLKRPSPEPQRYVQFSPSAASQQILSPPPVDEDDPRTQLAQLAKQLNLPTPDYKITVTNHQIYYCRVSLGSGHQYTNYPLDAASQEEAEKFAAASAVAHLSKLHATNLNKKVTDDKRTIKERLLQLVATQPYGIFLEKIAATYKNEYGEDLPDDYINIIETSSEFSLEKGVGDKLIVSKFDPQVEKRKSVKLDTKPSPVVYNAFPPLMLPSEELWAVYVTYVASVSEVWVRLLESEFQDKFLALSQELNQHYSLINELTLEVIPLKYYAAKVDDEFHRVRVEGFDQKTGLAEIFFIDTGEYERVEVMTLYPLNSQFFSVPAQAVRVSLYGVDKVANCETTIEITERLATDNSMYLQVLGREEDDVSLVAVGILFDTTGDGDVNVNEKITAEVEEVLEHSELDVLLAKKTRIFDAHISHIEYNGDVYIQIKSDGLLILTTMLNNLLADEELVQKIRFSASAQLQPTEMYLAPRTDSNSEQEYVRVTVAFPNSTNSKMRMVDYGSLLDVDKSKLLKLRELSAKIARYPPRAILVELNNIPKEHWNEKMLTMLKKLAPPMDSLVCKVIQNPGYAKAPVVELFRRNQHDNQLVSINMGLELSQALGDNNNNVKPKKRLERSASKTHNTEDVFFEAMKQPKIPALHKYFEVHVIDAVASPSNFVVQPYAQINQLEEMMQNLQYVYNNYNGAPVNLEALKEGKIYAAKNNAGVWYRVCIHRILDSPLLAVYLLDFGNIEVIGLDQLQPLKSEFMDLPCQAIRASLYGIQPIHGDWSPPTVMRFQKLVVNKNFVSVVRELSTNSDSPTNLLLHLDLIDVSAADVDVHIDKVLIEEQRAIPKPE